MKKTKTIKELRRYLDRSDLSPSGFVPTMGALHKGHLSLVKRAVETCPVVSVSIFINPTQFDDPDDLTRYPRTPEADIALLSSVLRENDLLFMPEVQEIYPEPDTRRFSFGHLGKVMEGAHRPGHFNGVAQVVSKLFDIVKPDIAFFGQKDFQQLTIIKELVKQTGRRIKIISCPIVREADGLAMSSRNKLLEPEIRELAGIIFRVISQAAGMAGREDISGIKDIVKETINNTAGFSLEYFEIADDVELKLIQYNAEAVKGRNYYACIAVKAGKIRLIDNVEFPLL